MVVKYADNVLKGFATSVSILLSALVSALYFHDLLINYPFLVGSVIVLFSVYLYGYTPSSPTPSTNAIAGGVSTSSTMSRISSGSNVSGNDNSSNKLNTNTTTGSSGSNV